MDQSTNPRLMFLDRISDFKNLEQGFEDQSTNLDSNPQPYMKILDQGVQMCGQTSETQISDMMG